MVIKYTPSTCESITADASVKSGVECCSTHLRDTEKQVQIVAWSCFGSGFRGLVLTLYTKKWVNDAICHQKFQVPKMEVLNLIAGYSGGGFSLT